MSAKSQQVVYEITHDIRSLDYARNNITTWIELIIKIKTFGTTPTPLFMLGI